ncbi:hypothetical protein M9458_054399 [Cirrhinus mrigala]|uniref:Uncharacterized protein n=1 Tax=Cirrhinus mrigala TaxID=683832 RepID=A0ABD0MNT5_CIRMR
MRGSVDLPPVSLSHRKLLCTLWCLLDSKTSLCCLLSRLSSLSLRLLIIQRQPELRSSAAAVLKKEKKKKKKEKEEKKKKQQQRRRRQQQREGRWRTSCCSRPGTSSQKIQDPAVSIRFHNRPHLASLLTLHNNALELGIRGEALWERPGKALLMPPRSSRGDPRGARTERILQNGHLGAREVTRCWSVSSRAESASAACFPQLEGASRDRRAAARSLRCVSAAAFGVKRWLADEFSVFVLLCKVGLQTLLTYTFCAVEDLRGSELTLVSFECEWNGVDELVRACEQAVDDLCVED